MRPELEKKVQSAIHLIQAASEVAKKVNQPIEVAFSGGKDSAVILELTKMANVPYRAIYKNTSIDPPGTIKYCKDNGVEIMKPQKTFYELLKKHGYPSRLIRFCCKYLKEYKILDVCVMGIRKSESKRRNNQYKEPTECKFYGSKKNHVEAFYPILEWNDQDIEQFIQERKIKCHPLYYDEKGVFHVERRLGCLCCPMKSRKQRINDFMKYPNMVKLYIRGCWYYFDSKRFTKNNSQFNNVYEKFVCLLFCDNLVEFKKKFGKNLFNDGIDCKTFLEDYFNIKF